MDYTTLKALKPSEFSNAADGYRRTSDMAGAAKDRIENQITVALRKDNEGEAADAAVKQLRKLAENFRYVQVECGLVAAALEGFTYELEAAKKKLDAAVEGAQAAKLTVNSDGSVSYPPGGEKDEDDKLPKGGTVTGLTDPTASAVGRQSANFDPNPLHRPAQDCADQIAAALEEATEADKKWAPKLRALKADDDLTVSARDWANASSDTKGVQAAGKEYLDSLPQPPKDGSPTDNAEWWKELDAEQQAAWVSMRPNAVGALDGLPSTVRDEANRHVFDETRGRLQTELNLIPKPPANEWTWIAAGRYPAKVHTDEWMEWHQQYGDRQEQLTKSLKGMQSIQDRFDQTGKDTTGTGGLPEAYLLGFSSEGNGRAIVANGNPDTSDHQAVYVPGTTSNLEKVKGDLNRMTDLWRVANSEAHGQSVSTITWLGYDAPQSLVKDSPFEHYAYDGAPAFRDFMDGLEASYSGDSDPHRTVIAHSYGSTLVGAAAETGRLNADDVVLAGSPGVKVSHATDLDVPKGHVWNQEANGDIVPDLGRFGHGGDGWVVPSDQSFGANQVITDTEGHSNYWDVGSDSLRNQALVTVGKGDDVPLELPPNPWAHVK